ncbi:MAG: hypothetical protein OQL27_01315 [Sedimenticola sp.]|nr:hypothetical protein [Sedimenticola sp.]
MVNNNNNRIYGLALAILFCTSTGIQASPLTKPDSSAQETRVLNHRVLAQNATVRDHRKTDPSTTRSGVPRKSNSTTTVDHRRDKQRAINEVSDYLVWMIGANNTGVVDAVTSLRADSISYYNLKGLQNKKFLQYERQGTGRGINLGWTNNASAQTAQKQSRWIFVPKDQSGRVSDIGAPTRKTPIRFGERIAIAWIPKKKSKIEWKFIKYAKRTFGINLDWSSTPRYEWTILGGKPGEIVDRGQDKVIIYNLVNKQPLVYFPRNIGGHIGWPNSKDDIGTSTTILKPSPPHSVFRQLMMKNAY